VPHESKKHLCKMGLLTFTMRAARLHEYTEEMKDALSIDQVDRPKLIGADDILVEVEGAGWCMTDNHVIKGTWDPYVDFPVTLGHETAGKVVETNTDVTQVSAGDNVLCYPIISCGSCSSCRAGNDMYCNEFEFPGITVDGGFAEYMKTTERAVVPLPDSVDPVNVAAHADAGLAAYHAGKKVVSQLNPGDHALIIGIGGLGHIGLQVVDEMSAAKIIAVDIKDDALELANNLGADYTINSRTDDVLESVSSIAGDGVQQAMDFVGSNETTGYATDILASGGDFHLVGYEDHIHEHTLGLVGDELTFEGTLAGTYNELEELVALAEEQKIDLRVSEFDLEDINTVAARLEQGDISGRAVITL
jgi:NAD+-dependent secondary alcohol dehydrogenase Adh1